MGKRKRVAMVLAAGLGTRLRPLTFEIPKPAIPVLGRPLITYTLEFLSRFNVREVVINLHRIPGAVRSKVLEWGKFPGRVSFVIEPEILGTGGGIRNALPHFSGAEEVIVANSDTIVDFDMEKALAHHRKRKNLATLVLFPLREKRYTPVYTDGKNSLLSIGAPSQGEGPFFFTGVSILRREFIERIPPGKRCLIRDGILPLVREGKGAGGFVTEGNFMEFGTPSDYLENTLLLLEKASPPLPGLESARVIPPAWISPGARVEDGATVGPGAVLEERSKVGEGAKISHSIVWPGGEVPPGDTADGVIVTPHRIVSAREPSP